MKYSIPLALLTAAMYTKDRTGIAAPLNWYKFPLLLKLFNSHKSLWGPCQDTPQSEDLFILELTPVINERFLLNYEKKKKKYFPSTW